MAAPAEWTTRFERNRGGAGVLEPYRRDGAVRSLRTSGNVDDRGRAARYHAKTAAAVAAVIAAERADTRNEKGAVIEGTPVGAAFQGAIAPGK